MLTGLKEIRNKLFNTKIKEMTIGEIVCAFFTIYALICLSIRLYYVLSALFVWILIDYMVL